MNLVKKIDLIVDNFTETEKKRLQLIQNIQEMFQVCKCKAEIRRKFKLSNATINKYLQGEPEVLCRSNRRSLLDQYRSFIIKNIADGMTQSEVARKVKNLGASSGFGNIRAYIMSVVKQHGLKVTKYVSASADTETTDRMKIKATHITRKGIFNYLWMNGELATEHHEFLWSKYHSLPELEKCIREFREIFKLKNMPRLFLFIEKYKQSAFKELASFANGLEKDIKAVENAVSSNLSNGFVEGTNSKVKMVKRTMYGRCSQKLLAAKLMFEPR